MLNEFKAFIARGNVVDLAVAVVIGAAFGRITSTLVEGIIMPPIGLLLGGIDFNSLFYVLDSSRGMPASLDEAKSAGIPVMAYGKLVNDVVTFLIVGFVMFLVVKSYNQLKSEPPKESPTTKPCPFCLSSVAIKATRCPQCTSTLDGAE